MVDAIRAPARRGEPASLYAMAFIDGFSKPSYVVATIAFDSAIAVPPVRRAVRELVERHPLLRSHVERSWLGLPSRFRYGTTEAWLASGGLCVDERFDLSALPALERELLGTPMDLGRQFPFRAWHLTGDAGDGRRRTVLMAKAHHAIVDAHSGGHLMRDFAGLCAAALRGASTPPPPPAISRPSRPAPLPRLWTWLRQADLSARVPEVSLLADLRPRAPLPELPVDYRERTLHVDDYARFTRRAAERRLSSSQALCVALLRAMDDYNQRAAARMGRAAPERVELMFAQSRRFSRRERERAEGFRADTRRLAVPRPWLLAAGGRVLEQYVQRQLRPRRDQHNDLALGALVLGRRMQEVVGGARRPEERPAAGPHVAGVHFTLSDLTSGATRMPSVELAPGLEVRSMRYLVSPVAAAHAGLLVQRHADVVRLTVVQHRGALDADELLDLLLERMDERDAEQRSQSRAEEACS